MIDPIAKLMGEWSATTTAGSISFKLLISITISVIIGCERSSKRHSAGLRTFMIMSLASTMVGMLELFIVESFGTNILILSGASLIALAMLSSNSILFTSKNQIRGLTTSVTFWATGIICLCLGLGFYTIAFTGFILNMISLSVFPSLERYLKDRSNHFEIYLELASNNSLSEFVSIIRRLGLKIDDIESNPAYLNSGLSVFTVSLTIVSPELKKYKTHIEIIKALSSLDYVRHIEEM